MKPTIPQVLPLVKYYYSLPGHAVGGSLHLVLSEPNYESSSVQYCFERAKDKNDFWGMVLAKVLLKMSPSQRSRIAIHHYDYYKAF